MPQPHLILLLASGLTAQLIPAARHPAPAASDAQTHLVCSLNTGPRAGHQEALPPSTTLKLGDACSDGAESSGLVIVATIPSHAGLSDIFDKIRNTSRGEAGSSSYPAPQPAPDTREHPPATTTDSTTDSTVRADREDTAPASPTSPPPPPAPASAAATAAEHNPPHTTVAPIQPPKPELPVQAQGAAPGPPPDESEQVHRWFQNLEKGSATYSVPASMVLGQTYSATAVIHPPTSPTPADPNAHALKISPYMRIVLNQTANPGTFEIRPDGNDCKFVSMDADTTWIFSVKPLLPGKDRALDFAAYVVYGTGDATCRPENLKTIDVLSDTERVTVAAITPRKAWQDIVVSFITDPAKWFKFILPGGLGFAALKWFIDWWKKRRSARLTATTAHHTP